MPPFVEGRGTASAVEGVVEEGGRAGVDVGVGDGVPSFLGDNIQQDGTH